MAEKNNATCSICGEPYYMCGSCRDEISMTPWKMHTDTIEHFKIYQVLHGYSTGVYTKTEAKSKLKNVDLSDIDTLRDNIKELLKSIIGEDKKIKQVKKEQDENVVSEMPMFPIKETPPKEETVVPAEEVSEAVEAIATESVAQGETDAPRRRKRFQ